MKDKKENYPIDQFPDEFDITKNVSVTDCTGLIPSALKNEAEEESYLAICRYMADSDEK